MLLRPLRAEELLQERVALQDLLDLLQLLLCLPLLLGLLLTLLLRMLILVVSAPHSAAAILRRPEKGVGKEMSVGLLSRVAAPARRISRGRRKGRRVLQLACAALTSTRPRTMDSVVAVCIWRTPTVCISTTAATSARAASTA